MENVTRTAKVAKNAKDAKKRKEVVRFLSAILGHLINIFDQKTR